MKKYPDKYNCTLEEVTHYRGVWAGVVAVIEIAHKQTHQNLHAISLAEAYRMASLLDLEARVCQWYNDGVVPEAE